MKSLIKILKFIFEKLSYRQTVKFGRFLGGVFYYILNSRRRVAIKNARIIGVKNPEKTARESFKNNFVSFLEIFFIKKSDRTFIEENVIIEEVFLKKIHAVNEKYPAYFAVGGHIGSWELCPKLFSDIFHKKGAIVGRSIKNKDIDELVKDMRSSENVLYLSHRNVAFAISKLVTDGFSVGTLLDHGATHKDSVYVDFFGIKTSFIAGIPILSVKKNIPIVPIFLIRDCEKLKFICYDEILPDLNLAVKERIKDVALKINRVYEDIITKYPEQWFLIHKRFKRMMNKNGEISDSVYR